MVDYQRDKLKALNCRVKNMLKNYAICNKFCKFAAKLEEKLS